MVKGKKKDIQSLYKGKKNTVQVPFKECKLLVTSEELGQGQ